MTHKTTPALPPQWSEMIEASRAARANAHAPFSGYPVGAAVLTQDGRIFGGCNVENSSYGLTICAERIAVGSAVAAGQKKIMAVAISLTGVAIPCGACRQVLYDFNPDMTVVIDDLSKDSEEPPEAISLRDLLPRGFRFAMGDESGQNNGQ